jgi:hypothetical protein
MALNLVKLCVGVESIEHLQESIDRKLVHKRTAGEEAIIFHITRMFPKRADELVDGGSLYWVIKGNVQVRQRIEEVRPVTDHSGVSRCKIVLRPKLVPTEWQPRRAFQGWRYLKDTDVPRDLKDVDNGVLSLPAELRRELADLGLL